MKKHISMSDLQPDFLLCKIISCIRVYVLLDIHNYHVGKLCDFNFSNTICELFEKFYVSFQWWKVCYCVFTSICAEMDRSFFTVITFIRNIVAIFLRKWVFIVSITQWNYAFSMKYGLSTKWCIKFNSELYDFCRKNLFVINELNMPVL